MSLVGPRPEIPRITQLYSQYQSKRLKIKPGLTGYAQVNGRSIITYGQKVEYDLFYIRNRTFAMDVKIILITIVLVIRGCARCTTTATASGSPRSISSCAARGRCSACASPGCRPSSSPACPRTSSCSSAPAATRARSSTPIRPARARAHPARGRDPARLRQRRARADSRIDRPRRGGDARCRRAQRERQRRVRGRYRRDSASNGDGSPRARRRAPVTTSAAITATSTATSRAASTSAGDEAAQPGDRQARDPPASRLRLSVPAIRSRNSTWAKQVDRRSGDDGDDLGGRGASRSGGRSRARRRRRRRSRRRPSRRAGTCSASRAISVRFGRPAPAGAAAIERRRVEVHPPHRRRAEEGEREGRQRARRRASCSDVVAPVTTIDSPSARMTKSWKRSAKCEISTLPRRRRDRRQARARRR